MGLPLILLLLCVYLSFSSQYFLEYQNLLNITEAVAVVGIAAAFATIVVIGGGIDLTPVTVMVMAGHRLPARAERRAAGSARRRRRARGRRPGSASSTASLIAIGALNPFIVTLGTNFLFTGIAYVVTDGNSQLISSVPFAKIGQSQLPGRHPGLDRDHGRRLRPRLLPPAGDALRHARVRDRRRRGRGPALRRPGRAT